MNVDWVLVKFPHKELRKMKKLLRLCHGPYRVLTHQEPAVTAFKNVLIMHMHALLIERWPSCDCYVIAPLRGRTLAISAPQKVDMFSRVVPALQTYLRTILIKSRLPYATVYAPTTQVNTLSQQNVYVIMVHVT